MHPNVQSCIVHNSQAVEGAKYLSTDEWIKKIWSIHTMEYYSAIRKNDYPTFTATWMGLAEIMLSAISQAEKDNYHMISVIYGS